jgi:arginase family enzyme
MSGPPDFRLEHSGLRGGDEFSESSRPGARFGPRAIRMAPTVWSYRDARSIQAGTAPYALLPVADAGETPAAATRFERARPAQASADSRERSS